MKFNHIILSSLLALSGLGAAWAIPADPRPRVYTQPDGSEITLTLHGDAFFHYYADTNGQIMKYQSGKFIPTGIQATTANINALRAQAATRGDVETRVDVAADGRSPFPTTAEGIRGLVVLMQYSDIKFTIPDIENAINRLVNEEGYDGYGGCGSARDWYIASSGGQFAPTFDVAPMVTLSRTSEYYAGDNGWARFSQAGLEALEILEKQGFDFSKYDYDNNGVVDNVFFFFAGYGKADSNRPGVVWPHKSYFYDGPVYDGVKFDPYACGNELKYNIPRGETQPYLDGIGTFTHEFGHVLGFADHYDASYGDTDEPREMDIMSTGCYNDYSTRPPSFSAYERWFCRWIEYEEITEPGHYVLDNLEDSHKAYRLSVAENENEYFLIESRSNTHWDKAMPDHGCTFWHVDYSYLSWIGNSVNYNGRSRLNIIRPNPANLRDWCYGTKYTYTFPGYSGQLKPATRNSKFEAYITNISYDEETGRVEFDYGIDTNISNVATVLHDNPTCDKYNRDVFLSWDAVEGISNYALTVYYYSARGDMVYINDLNETLVGDVTEYTLKDLPSNAWRSECHAMVRVIDGLPSSSLSNEVVFTPRDLPESAVEELQSDSSLEAEWFTIEGLRVNPDDARPGTLYIIKSNDRTYKVIK